jgi:hypothetical protein
MGRKAMSKSTDFVVVDADAHVLETERTWDYLEPSEQKYRPLLYSTADNPRQYWVVDGKISGFRFLTLSERGLRTMSEKIGRNVETPRASRELDDVELRLKHMDELVSTFRCCTIPCGLNKCLSTPTLRPRCAAAGTAGSAIYGDKVRDDCVGLVSYLAY